MKADRFRITDQEKEGLKVFTTFDVEYLGNFGMPMDAAMRYLEGEMGYRPPEHLVSIERLPPRKAK